MPLIFIGHGSPMNAIENNAFTQSLTLLSKKLVKPKYILVISAHWVTDGSFVTSADKPKQIYDFYGFPNELYEIKYPCRGSNELAQHIFELSQKGAIGLSDDWGIDHGAWTILKYLFPGADVPVVQLSLDYNLNEKQHLALVKNLDMLRDEGVLIIGSGNIVHNLGMMSPLKNDIPYEWNIEFNDYIKKALSGNDLQSILNYRKIMQSAANYAVPTDEHYLPLIYVFGLKRETETINLIYEGFEYKSLSMLSFIIS